jgi:hypothetical protein
MKSPRIELERRITHRYNEGWSHLDQHEYIGTARVLSRKPHGSEDYESKKTFSLLLVTSKEPLESIKEAIEDTFRHACRCEHDCCGHIQSRVNRVRRLKSGLWAVIESHSRNI